MTDLPNPERDSSPEHPFSSSPAELAFDPELLAGELAQELAGDPLDALDALEPAEADIAAECDLGLQLLAGSQEQRMQGLRIFCEHRDPRAIPLLLPLLAASCPILRMSAVYALGRNPDPRAVEPLLALLQDDSNGYVRKAVAWSLGNYPEAPVLNPLIRALGVDIAAVRLWAAGSLADAGSTGTAKADQASAQLLQSLRIDSEPVVRSNCAWSLGRLHDQLVEPRQRELVETLVEVMLHDGDATVRDEARVALEQLESSEVLERLQTLVDEGLLT
jgi:HEAT repeat protein